MRLRRSAAYVLHSALKHLRSRAERARRLSESKEDEVERAFTLGRSAGLEAAAGVLERAIADYQVKSRQTEVDVFRDNLAVRRNGMFVEVYDQRFPETTIVELI